MSQGHRRHGGGGYTLLYYIGLEGKEDRRTEEQKTEEQKNKNRWKGEQEQGGKGERERRRMNRKKGARGPEKARKLSPDALEQPYRALGATLQLSCSIVTGLLEKVYGCCGNVAFSVRMTYGLPSNPDAKSAAVISSICTTCRFGE